MAQTLLSSDKNANAEVVSIDPERPFLCGIALEKPENIWGPCRFRQATGTNGIHDPNLCHSSILSTMGTKYQRLPVVNSVFAIQIH